MAELSDLPDRKQLAASTLRRFERATEKAHDAFVSIPAVDDACFEASIEALDRKRDREDSLKDIVQTAVEFEGYGHYRSIRPQQIFPELQQLAETVDRIDPRTVVEIGTAEGGTFYTWSRFFENATLLVSIDLPGGDFGGGYEKERTKLYDAFDPESRSAFIRGDSHTEAAKSELERVLDGREIDFLFVDGDHTYDGVKRDFEMYSPLVSDGGIIAFHDIVEHEYSPDCNVHEFWTEIEGEYETERLIASPEYQVWGGIGVVYW